MAVAAITIWQQHDRSGGWVLGNWLDQPLDLLCQLEVIDLMVHTRRYMNSKGADLAKLSTLQADLIAWIDNDVTTDERYRPNR